MKLFDEGQKFSIRGSQRASDGTIDVSGSKNASLPILLASLAIGGRVHLKNLPLGLLDVRRAINLLESCGVHVEILDGSSALLFRGGGMYYSALSKCFGIRYQILAMGSVLSQAKRVAVCVDGGCQIGGSRPIDIHLDGFRALGCDLEVYGNIVEIRLEGNGHSGREFSMRFPSVGATENLLIFCSTMSGRRIIRNCALEPEVWALVHFLRIAGSLIYYRGDRVFEVYGGRFSSVDIEYSIPSDRIEMASYAALAIMIGKRIKLTGVDWGIDYVRRCILACPGVSVDPFMDQSVIVSGNAKYISNIRARSGPYPGVPTDLVPIIAALASVAPGDHFISDEVFPNRVEHVDQLNLLGAILKREISGVSIIGVSTLRGGVVNAMNIRCGMALLLASAVAEGDSIIYGAESISRGYERIRLKLGNVGIIIE